MSMALPEPTMYLLTLTRPVYTMALAFTGPLLAAVAVLLIPFPRLQPVRLLYPILGLCVFLALPIPDFFWNFYPFGFTLRPVTPVLGLVISITYLVMVTRLKLPRLTAVPAVMLLLASLADGRLAWSIVSGEFPKLIGIGG